MLYQAFVHAPSGFGHVYVPFSITLDTYSHAMPPMQEAAALITGLVFAGE